MAGELNSSTLTDDELVFVRLADEARLVRATYPDAAAKYQQARRYLTDERPIARREPTTYQADLQHAYRCWAEVCTEAHQRAAKLADAVARLLPSLWPTLRLLGFNRGPWHTVEAFDWDTAETELRKVEAAALSAIAEPGEVNGDAASPEPPDASAQTVEPVRESISIEEADAVARKLAAKHPTFTDGGKREWAAEITRETGKRCSQTTAGRTPFWRETMAQTGRGRSGGPEPKAAEWTEAVEASAAGREDDPLARLIAEEELRAAEAVKASGLDDGAKAETLARLHDGSLTPAQAEAIAAKFPENGRDKGRFRRV